MPELPHTVLRHRFRIDCQRNPWFSIGVHLDHQQWLLQIHLPGVILQIGWRNRETETYRCPCGRADSWTWRWRHEEADRAE